MPTGIAKSCGSRIGVKPKRSGPRGREHKEVAPIIQAVCRIVPCAAGEPPSPQMSAPHHFGSASYLARIVDQNCAVAHLSVTQGRHRPDPGVNVYPAPGANLLEHMLPAGLR